MTDDRTTDAVDGDGAGVLATGALVTVVEGLVRELLAAHLGGTRLFVSGADISQDLVVPAGGRVAVEAELYAVHPPRVTFVADVRRVDGEAETKVGTVTVTLRTAD